MVQIGLSADYKHHMCDEIPLRQGSFSESTPLIAKPKTESKSGDGVRCGFDENGELHISGTLGSDPEKCW